MTRKDYELLADAIKQSKGESFSTLVDLLCDALHRDNARFDQERFKVACGAIGEDVPARTPMEHFRQTLTRRVDRLPLNYIAVTRGSARGEEEVSF